MRRFTYFAHCRETGLTKIGSSANPRARVKQLRPASTLFAVVPDETLSESDAHAMFSESRVMGEWFNADRRAVIQSLRLQGIAFLKSSSLREEMAKPERQDGKRTITVCVPDELARKVHVAARKDHRTVSGYIRVRLEEALGLRKPAPQPQTTET